METGKKTEGNLATSKLGGGSRELAFVPNNGINEQQILDYNT